MVLAAPFGSAPAPSYLWGDVEELRARSADEAWETALLRVGAELEVGSSARSFAQHPCEACDHTGSLRAASPSAFAFQVYLRPCEACSGTGWRLGPSPRSAPFAVALAQHWPTVLAAEEMVRELAQALTRMPWCGVPLQHVAWGESSAQPCQDRAEGPMGILEHFRRGECLLGPTPALEGLRTLRALGVEVSCLGVTPVALLLLGAPGEAP